MKISPEVMRERSTVMLWDTLRGSGSSSFIKLYTDKRGMKKSDVAVWHNWDASERVAWAIKQGADVSTEHNEKFPALAAVELGNARLFAVLIAAGAPLEKSGIFKRGMHPSCRPNKPTRHVAGGAGGRGRPGRSA